MFKDKVSQIMKISQFIRSAAIATTIATAAIIAPISANAVIAPIASSAATFTFGNIFNSNGDPADDQNGVTDGIANQFTFEVLADTSTTSKWLFRNNGATESFIGQIYIDWTSPLGISQLNAAGTTPSVTVPKGRGTETIDKVLFTQGSGNVPQGNGNTNFVADLALDADKPGTGKQGIDVGETLAVIFSGGSAADIEQAINLGQLRVGLHVQGITSRGFSDAYINTITTPPVKPVPVPGFLLGLVAAGAFGGTRLLKNKKQAV